VADGKMADVSKLAHAKYQLIHGEFQAFFERIKMIVQITKVLPSSPRYTSLVIADNLFGLTKEDWDKENDMSKLKEFEDLLLFFKVLNYSLIAEFVL
jgi:hypothetical protein